MRSSGSQALFLLGGSVSDIRNSGVMSGKDATIQNSGVIGTLTNTGTMSVSTAGRAMINNGAISLPGGTITTLNNGGMLTYTGRLPTQYNIIIQSSGKYGQLVGMAYSTGSGLSLRNFAISGSTSFGIDTGSKLKAGTYAAVLQGFDSSNISATTRSGTSGRFTWELSDVDADRVWDLVITGGGASATLVSAVPASLNSAGQGAVGALQSIFDAGASAAFQAVFDQLDSAVAAGTVTASGAVSQLLPSLTGAGSQAGMNALHSMNKIIQSRMESNQGLSSGDAPSDTYLWLRPFATGAHQSDRNTVSGFKSRTSGLVLGADGPLDSRVRAGGAFTFARSTINNNSASNRLAVDTYELVGYASYNLDPVTDLNLQLDIGKNAAQSSRQISFLASTASASFDSLVLHGSAGIGRTFALNPSTAITPSARLDYTRVRTDGYTESGAGALNLQVNASTYREFLLSTEAKLVQQIDDTLKWSANLGAAYDFINRQAVSVSSFSGGGPSFVTNGIQVSPWLYRMGLGIIKDRKKGMEYSLRLDSERRTSGYSNTTVSARLRWMY